MTKEELYHQLYDELWRSIDGNGYLFARLEITENGTTTEIELSGEYETDGYCENDYFNGTGNWVTTYADVNISDIEAYAFDENDEEIENEITRLAKGIDIVSLEKDLKAELWAA